MDPSTLDALRRNFGDVAATVGEGLSAANSHVLALAAKWDKTDLVPGLSDMDFRVICDDDTTVDDWVEIDWHTGRLHLEMVRENPQWNRINEHTAGAAVTISEAFGECADSPEQAHWSLWWGRRDWFDRLKLDVAARPFAADDEYYHLSKFLHYCAPYDHEIDPPINLGQYEPKYSLHSRCWHYFAPPMLSAAALLARKNFSGKRAALAWLRENGCVAELVDEVLHQVDTHYETPELTDPDRLQAFEEQLFVGFEKLLPLVVESIQHLDIDRLLSPAKLTKQLASGRRDPLAVLAQNTSYARIRAGRYYFHANAPVHFDTKRLIQYELPWLRRLCGPLFASLRTLLGDETLSLEQCFCRLELNVGKTEHKAIQNVFELADRAFDDQDLPMLFSRAVEWFPCYYRLMEGALARMTTGTPEAQPSPVSEMPRRAKHVKA